MGTEIGPRKPYDRGPGSTRRSARMHRSAVLTRTCRRGSGWTQSPTRSRWASGCGVFRSGVCRCAVSCNRTPDRESQSGPEAHDGPFCSPHRDELSDPSSLGTVPVLVFDDLSRQLDPAQDDARLDTPIDTGFRCAKGERREEPGEQVHGIEAAGAILVRRASAFIARGEHPARRGAVPVALPERVDDQAQRA
jgi:hypothetical protein